MPLRLATITNHIALGRSLTLEEDSKARESLRVLRHYLNDHGPHVAMQKNFQEFDHLVGEFADAFNRDQRALMTSQHLDAMMLEANRLLMNALGSTRSYIDMTDRRLGQRGAALQARYRAWRSLMYDQSLSYRIFENLRNVAQHIELPIRAFSAVRERTKDGTYRASQVLMIDREAFLKAEKIQPRVRDELARLKGNIPVVEHAREYLSRLAKVQALITRETVGEYVPHAEFVEQLVREAGDPLVVPVYFIDLVGEIEVSIELNLIDPMMHAVALVRLNSEFVNSFDFRQIDADASRHPRWPGKPEKS